MNIEIKHRPAYAVAKVTLDAGEAIKAESGAMVAMSDGINIETGTQGGFLKAAGRTLFGGESFFQNRFVATGTGDEVYLAPTLPGDITHLSIDGSWTVQGSSYLASHPDITTSTKFQGLMKGFLSGEGMFMLKVEGRGDLLVSSFGALHEVDVDGDYIVDTGHLVAFDSGLEYKMVGMGNLFSTIFSGEGLACRFSGRGKLLIQSRHPQEYGNRVGHKLPPREQ